MNIKSKPVLGSGGDTDELLEQLRNETDSALQALNQSRDQVFADSEEEKHGLGGKYFEEEVKAMKKKESEEKKKKK